MNKIIRIVQTADGREHPNAGAYIKAYDPSGHDGRGDLRVTVIREDALQFESFEAAHEFWRQQSKTHPIRPDGKPNRPLSALTIEVEDATASADPTIETLFVGPFDPPTLDAHRKMFEENSEVFGLGLEVGQRVPCPFCAAPGWKSWVIYDLAENDYAAMQASSRCSNCGRSARFKITRDEKALDSVLVQTGGPNPPSYLQPWPEREVIASPSVIDGSLRRG